jgi:hypothetical protein
VYIQFQVSQESKRSPYKAQASKPYITRKRSTGWQQASKLLSIAATARSLQCLDTSKHTVYTAASNVALRPASVNSTMSPADYSGVVSPFEPSEWGEFFAKYLQQSYISQKACIHLYSHAHQRM